MLHATSMHNLYDFRYTIAPWGCKDHILWDRSRKIKEHQNVMNFLGAHSPPGGTTSSDRSPKNLPSPRRKQDGLPPQFLRDRGAKRIRSHYLPSPTEQPPGLSTRTPPKGPASFSTINAAIMRLCRADHPAPHRSIAAGSRSSSLSWGFHPVPRKGPATSSHLP
jgi:hypothetical protein